MARAPAPPECSAPPRPATRLQPRKRKHCRSCRSRRCYPRRCCYWAAQQRQPHQLPAPALRPTSGQACCLRLQRSASAARMGLLCTLHWPWQGPQRGPPVPQTFLPVREQLLPPPRVAAAWLRRAARQLCLAAHWLHQHRLHRLPCWMSRMSQMTHPPAHGASPVCGHQPWSCRRDAAAACGVAGRRAGAGAGTPRPRSRPQTPRSGRVLSAGSACSPG